MVQTGCIRQDTKDPWPAMSLAARSELPPASSTRESTCSSRRWRARANYGASIHRFAAWYLRHCRAPPLHRARSQPLLQGLISRMPKKSKSEALRVTRVRLCCSAVAAIKASIAPTGRPPFFPRAMTRPQVSAISVSTGSTRASNRAGSCSLTHASSRFRREPEGIFSIP
jgi:hypothetical protein